MHDRGACDLNREFLERIATPELDSNTSSLPDFSLSEPESFQLAGSSMSPSGVGSAHITPGTRLEVQFTRTISPQRSHATRTPSVQVKKMEMPLSIWKFESVYRQNAPLLQPSFRSFAVDPPRPTQCAACAEKLQSSQIQRFKGEVPGQLHRKQSVILPRSRSRLALWYSDQPWRLSSSTGSIPGASMMAAQKRNIACSFCAKRKVRCFGGRPCNRYVT